MELVDDDQMNDLTKLFQSALNAGHISAMETLIETKSQDRRGQVDCVFLYI